MDTHKAEKAQQIKSDMRLLELLSQTFPTIEAACTEIINLEAILNLPKGTEHFVADLHGEHEAFEHILRNASGNIKRKVKELYGETLSDEEISQLCSYTIPKRSSSSSKPAKTTTRTSTPPPSCV